MAEKLSSRFKNAWNAFNTNTQEAFINEISTVGEANIVRSDQTSLSYTNERSIVNSIYTRIAIDVASLKVFESIIDENDRIVDVVNSSLTRCLTLEANLDQTGRMLMLNACLMLFDIGWVAVIPVVTNKDPEITESYDIKQMRLGEILEWYPQHVKVRVYDERDGKRKDIVLPKRMCAIVENPFRSIMNAPNSTVKRLSRKQMLLDKIDERSGSGKLDLIIQLPYTIRSKAREDQAENRKQALERQLADSKYGIGYIDSTEKIVQLNRAVENNLALQVKDLTDQVYEQLGITKEILNGSANEQETLNYIDHTIEPIISAFVDEFKRKFLTETAIARKHSISFLRDPFKLVPVNNLADIADKFTRNEICSSNDIRSVIGFRLSKDPEADELRNKNLNRADNERLPVKNQNESQYDERYAEKYEKRKRNNE